jgi:SAM-dependent methyltransferase
MSESAPFNITLDPDHLRHPAIRPTATCIRRWTWWWLLRGQKLGVNASVKRRCYIRWHKLWEYSRGLALTGASRPARPRGRGTRFSVLDIGGAMTAPLFYLAEMGDRVISLDIDSRLVEQTNAVARGRSLDIRAMTTNLVDEDPSASDLGVAGGFDRVYCFCVIEHIVPPGQYAVARRMAGLLKPGGQMCLTFDYGQHAPTEAPMHTMKHVQALRDAVGLPLMGENEFIDNGKRFALDRGRPDHQYTFGSMFFQKPPAV